MIKCHFCGQEIKKTNVMVKLVAGELVPVCAWCYQMSLHYSKEEFLEHIKKIYNLYCKPWKK